MTPPVHQWKVYMRFYGEEKPSWSYEGRCCWLGSGVFDRTGEEIYEGDVVILGNQRGVVRFENAHFYIDRDAVVDSDAPEDEVVPFTLNCLCSPFIKIVGHIAEETNNEN